MTTSKQPPAHRCLRILAALVLAAGALPAAAGVESSPPVRVSMTLYDREFALVNELRRVTFAQGVNDVTVRDLPSRLDPGSVSFEAVGGAGKLAGYEQRFAYDLAQLDRLLGRYRGRAVSVQAGGESYRGVLAATPPGDQDGFSPAGLALTGADGTAVAFPDLSGVTSVSFPDAANIAHLEPTLLWRVDARREGPQNVRLSYVADDITWVVSYECILDEEATGAYLSGRVAIKNGSGGDFEKARVKLVVTEKGQLPQPVRMGAGGDTSAALRYAYGAPEPTFERMASSAAVVSSYELNRPVDLRHGETRYVELFTLDTLPVKRVYVYDGVRFDRFQRNPRTDWNYGTESHQVVDMHLEFENNDNAGPGQDLPPGRFRLYQAAGEGAIDLAGEDYFAGSPKGRDGHVLLGPARGIVAERARTGYTEVTPLHEYEESFEIRIENESDRAAEVRVVEHLYRWPEYEIIRADTEYEKTGPQTIEFRPLVKPGGKRSVHYSVRYSW